MRPGAAAHLKLFADNIGRAAPELTSTEQPKTFKAKKPKRVQGNAPEFNLTSELQRISGVDLTGIDGVSVIVAQTILMENRGAFRLVVRIVSRQPRQRGQGT